MVSAAQSNSGRWTQNRVILAGGLAALLALLIFLAWQMGLSRTLEAVILGLREAGPGVFFVAMALLPAVGFPLIAFTLAAGPVFGATLGTGAVIGWSLAAVVSNLLLTYWLANRALRPFANRLLTYFDYRLPDSTVGGAWQITLIVRLTPGPPFWVQSYLLGLIRVPLAPYLLVSTLVMAGYIVALVCGGEAIVESNGRLAAAAFGGLVIFVAALQLLRQRAVRRRVAAGPRAIPAK
ncbi:MAG: VTT domain-containing protein [Elusimicrobiota bacterium]|jgi:uncharacterized membrane protein YdjX (TVP38/TMEM64 family)